MTAGNPTTSEHNVNKKLTLLQYAMMIFMCTSGGPYGIEVVVKSGGVNLALLGLTLVPFLYSLPQSLMCAELSSMMPSNHGYIIWVYRACGEFIGFINAIQSVLVTMFDNPTYVAMLIAYITPLFNSSLSWYVTYSLKVFVIVLAGILNVLNITWMGNLSILMTVIIFLPFVPTIMLIIPNIKPQEQWLQSIETTNEEGKIEWGLFLTSILWLHSGWDTMGCLAGELGIDRSKTILSFLIAVLLDYFGYVIPLIGALTVPYTVNDWYQGYFLTAYNQILPGIKYFMLIGVVTSLFGLHCIELSALSRTIWAISQPYISIPMIDNSVHSTQHPKNTMDDNNAINMDSQLHVRNVPVNILPQFFGQVNEKTGSPIYAIILQMIINSILVIFEFDILISICMMLASMTFFFEFTSFLILRYKEPNASRPFMVPGGMCMAWIITIIKYIVVLTVLITTLIEKPYLMCFMFMFQIFACVWYGIRKYQERKQQQLEEYTQQEYCNCDEVTQIQIQMYKTNNNSAT